ncbi:hypothetical protein DSUL_100197 [Desulfovibrionales bacterium]
MQPIRLIILICVFSTWFCVTAIPSWTHAVALGKSGCVKGDCNNGQGIYIFEDGATYEGEWKNDQFQGQGTYVWPDGQKYIGGWTTDNQDGKGIIICPDGKKYNVEFNEGRITSKRPYCF